MPRSTRVKSPEHRYFQHKQWQQCMLDFLASVRSAATEKTYRNTLKRFFSDPKKTPDAYTRADVERFISSPATTTRNNRLSALKSFYAYAATYDVPFRKSTRPILHTSDPTRHVKRGRISPKPRAFTRDDLQKLFSAIPRDTIKGKRDRALFLCYFWTARRRAEIARLAWGDFEQVVFIESGKSRAGWLYSWIGKGNQDKAEMPEPAMAAIREYLEADERWLKMQPDEPIFRALDHARQGKVSALTPDGINVILSKYLQKADINGVSVHGFRHSAARLRHSHGESVVDIKRFLGHASLNTTYVYLQSLEQQADSGAQKLYGEFAGL
jgi:integrase/recombinase XerD